MDIVATLTSKWEIIDLMRESKDILKGKQFESSFLELRVLAIRC